MVQSVETLNTLLLAGGRGGGKSVLLVWLIIYFALLTGESFNGVLIRADLAGLQKLEGMLLAALVGMSPTVREIVALRHFQELDNGEVAAVLGLSAKAASIRYVRAIGRLRAILERLPEFERGPS